jgi:nucleotide-binding universal stress UspA family protein
MKNIIAAVDFSKVSVNAARYAVQLGEFYKANLWVYHSYQLPVTANEIGYPFIGAAELQDLADFQMQELVKELSLIPKQPVTINSRVELINLMDGLQAFCDEVKADLLVMGITGKSALKRLLVGSNTLHAIQHLHCPVLIVPAGAGFSAWSKIGLAIDYENPIAPVTVGIINSITTTFNASLYVINVDWNDRHHTDAGKQREALLHQQLTAGNVHFRSLQNEHVATAIHEFVKDEPIDLLITLPKKHNLVEKLFSAAHTPELLYHTDIPVLCIPE